MKIDQIQIRTTDAKLGLNITNPVQVIKQPQAQQHIEQPAAILKMNSTQAKLQIDSSQAYRDLGLYTTRESIQKFASEGRQKGLEGIGRRASEGRQMMNIGKAKGSAVPSIAQSNANPLPKNLGIAWKPSVESVKIKYIPGQLNIDSTPQKPKINVQIGKVEHDYKQGDVSGTMLQYPSIETTVIKGE
ncbi:hypothetical protein BK128_04300 [Viridibacillus sp. FSL H7-0596]|uniref:DUF6470 family protein n=1 Tax=Viridibacillus sp. FSL H7-0596 TaxID=1928923 RepID=UPI00096C8E25|nr:DUF6470 family protein [Viridibacillus sp. FSL H7-0596]OMC89156.1 hypothetical protein BK128_04300 [Viridibacillus sp. FSL H7-0596]